MDIRNITFFEQFINVVRPPSVFKWPASDSARLVAGPGPPRYRRNVGAWIRARESLSILIFKFLIKFCIFIFVLCSVASQTVHQIFIRSSYSKLLSIYFCFCLFLPLVFIFAAAANFCACFCCAQRFYSIFVYNDECFILT